MIQRKGPSTAAVVIILVIVAAVLALDRIAWASVSEWREDQATDIWLGYTQPALKAPVGIMSSRLIPNPNGLVLLSALLSHLPNLWVISAVLGLLQAALLGWLGWTMTRDRRILLVILGPLWSSITLRGISIELYGQWTLTLPNLLFAVAVLTYLRRATAWVIPVLVVVALLSASIYLAGALNAIAYAVVLGIVFVIRPPRARNRTWIAVLGLSLAAVALSAWITWLPYFREINLGEILRLNEEHHRTFQQRVVAVAESVYAFPRWSLAQFATDRLFPIPQVDQRILSPAAWSGYHLLLRMAYAQGILCYASILFGLISCGLRKAPLQSLVATRRRSEAAAALLMAVFVIICYGISPLLGPAYARGDRLDQVTQFLPFVLVFWFTIPLVLQLPSRAARALVVATSVMATCYTLISTVVGFKVVAENLAYRGDVLTGADVPLVHKLQVADFIARDWRQYSSRDRIPVSYELGGGNWEWVTSFGRTLLPWYRAPYTMGRAFDYTLLRGYGLGNTQEGIQRRSSERARYLVTYAFLPAPTVQAASSLRHYTIGRLRVTIIDR